MISLRKYDNCIIHDSKVLEASNKKETRRNAATAIGWKCCETHEITEARFWLNLSTCLRENDVFPICGFTVSPPYGKSILCSKQALLVTPFVICMLSLPVKLPFRRFAGLPTLESWKYKPFTIHRAAQAPDAASLRPQGCIRLPSCRRPCYDGESSLSAQLLSPVTLFSSFPPLDLQAAAEKGGHRKHTSASPQRSTAAAPAGYPPSPPRAP